MDLGEGTGRVFEQERTEVTEENSGAGLQPALRSRSVDVPIDRSAKCRIGSNLNPARLSHAHVSVGGDADFPVQSRFCGESRVSLNFSEFFTLFVRMPKNSG